MDTLAKLQKVFKYCILPKTIQNLKFCSIKIAHRPTYITMTLGAGVVLAHRAPI
jgi:hypothetical protein